MIIPLHPSLQVQHDEALRFLRIAWLSDSRAATLREAVSQFIELADQLQSEHVLLDLEKLFDLPVYDQLWISMTILPRALRLPVQRVVISLPEVQIYNREVLEFILRQYQHMRRLLSPSPCDVQFFSESDEAVDWLTNYSPRVPLLLTQWQEALDGRWGVGRVANTAFG